MSQIGRPKVENPKNIRYSIRLDAQTEAKLKKYCEENGKSYTFINDDEVEINGKRYEIYRGYENGSRGNYGIKCKEK